MMNIMQAMIANTREAKNISASKSKSKKIITNTRDLFRSSNTSSASLPSLREEFSLSIKDLYIKEPP